jgi:membrane protease YdiL (CAAX protease family)
MTADFIDNPSREPLVGSVGILLTTGVLSIGMAMPEATGIYVIGGLALLLIWALAVKSTAAVHPTIFGLLFFLIPHLGDSFRLWPLTLLAPIIAYGLITGSVPVMRRSVGWIRKGRMDRTILLMVIATAAISTGALVAWIVILKPDIGHHLRMMPRLPVWVYPFAGVGFAVLNAAMEEAVFRGVIMEALDRAVGASNISVGLQAVPFAALHYPAGFPNGFWGFMMTLVYGVMLGIIRRSAGGMLAVYIAHVAADVTIFSILTTVFLNT